MQAMEREGEEQCMNVRIGVREFTVAEDIAHFAICHMERPTPLPRLLAILANNNIYLFTQDLRSPCTALTNQSNLMDFCRLKVDIRHTYKLPQLLHTKLVYSSSCECFFVMLSNGQLVALTDELYMLDTVKIQGCEGHVKYCLDFDYFEKDGWRQARKVKNGYFVFMFSGSIEVHDVQIDTNHKLSKFRPGYKFTLTTLHSKTIQSRISHPLKLELLNYHSKPLSSSELSAINDFLYLTCNCSDSVFFYLFDKDSMELADSVWLEGVGQGNIYVSSVQVGVSNMRAILGMSNGQIRLYSLKKQNRGKILLTIDVCSLPVQNLLWNAKSQTFLSYSPDGFVYKTSLETMMVEQKYQTGVYSSTVLLSQRTLLGLGFKGHSIYNADQPQTHPGHLLILNQLTLSYQKLFEVNSAISRVTTFQQTRLIQLNDNALLFSKHDKQVSLIRSYAPPKCVVVRSVSRNIFKDNEYWLLTDRSEVYKYQITEKQVKVGGVLSLSVFKTRDDLEHKFRICYLVFSRKAVPIEFDSEVTKTEHPPTTDSHQKMQPVILGTTTGDLLLISLINVQLILFRVKYFDSPIKYILEIEPYFESDQTKAIIIFGSTQKGMIIDVCASKIPQKMHRLQLHQDRINPVNQCCFSIVNGVYFNLFYAKNDMSSGVQFWKEEHINPDIRGEPVLTCLSTTTANQEELITTGYSLGQVVVWMITTTVQKQGYISLVALYVLESSKQEPIQYAYFHQSHICFNMGLFFIAKQVPKKTSSVSQIFSNTNTKINKCKIFHQEQTTKTPRIKGTDQINPTLDISKISHKPHPYAIDLRSPTKKRKCRSSSMGKFTSQHIKLQSMFHFPDTQFYRSMINRNIIK